MSEILKEAIACVLLGWQIAFVDAYAKRIGGSGWITTREQCEQAYESAVLGGVDGFGVRAGFGVAVVESAGTKTSYASQAELFERGILSGLPAVTVQRSDRGCHYWLYRCDVAHTTFELAPGIRVLFDELVLLPPTSCMQGGDYVWRRDHSLQSCAGTPLPHQLRALFEDRSVREINRKEIGQAVLGAKSESPRLDLVALSVEQEEIEAAPSAGGAGGGDNGGSGAPSGGGDGGSGRPPPNGWTGEIVNGRPAIEIIPNEEQMGTAAIRVLAARPDVFQRGGTLCTIAYDRGKLSGVVRPRSLPRIVDLGVNRIRGMLSEEIYWYTWRTTRDANDQVVTNRVERPVPKELAANIASRFEFQDVRVIESVVETPILRPDGTICDTPGYDEATGVFYAPIIDFPKIPESPTAAEVAEACKMLREPFLDFPFSDPEVGLAGAIAGLLSPMARYAFKGPVPMFLIDANTRGTGKSLLVDVFSHIITGRPMPRTTATESDEEMRKRITALALSSPPMILLDNVVGSIGGPSLDSALTALLWNDRVLGLSKDVEKPLLSVWFATGNNLQIKGDLSRRNVRIRFDTMSSRPHNRSDFKHPNILEWVNENRGVLISSALTILRGYFAAGKPRYRLKAWGSFEDWSRVVRCAMVWAGFEDPYRTQEGAQAMDPDEQAKYDLVLGFRSVAEACGGECTLTQALELLERNERKYLNGDLDVERFLQFRSALNTFCDLRTTHDLPSAKACGKLFSRFRGVVLDEENICISSRTDGHRYTHWRVETADEFRDRLAAETAENAKKNAKVRDEMLKALESGKPKDRDEPTLQ